MSIKLPLNSKKIPLLVAATDDTFRNEDISKLKKYNVDVIELRIDKFSNLNTSFIISRLMKIKKLHLPVIATIRSVSEGGEKYLTSKKRLDIFKNIIPLSDYIDIELSSDTILKEIIRTAHNNNTKVIISYHIYLKAKKEKADIIKIAAKTNSTSDLQRLLLFTLTYKKDNMIIIPMGKTGTLGRVFFPAAGSLLTYTYLSKNTAPGQISLEKMSEMIKLFYPDKN